MTVLEVVQLLLYLIILVLTTPLLGGYMAKVFEGERTFLSPVFEPIERATYAICRDMRCTSRCVHRANTVVPI